MTMNNLVDIHPFQRARRLVSIGSSIGNLLLMIDVARTRRATIRELQSLNDAQLEDIGIPRWAIRDVVKNVVTGGRKQPGVNNISKLTGNDPFIPVIDEKRAA